MKKANSLALINSVIVSYFILIWLLYFYKVESTILGVFVELLTIPFLIGQLVFLILGAKHIFKQKTNRALIISLVLLAICTIATFTSLFLPHLTV